MTCLSISCPQVLELESVIALVKDIDLKMMGNEIAELEGRERVSQQMVMCEAECKRCACMREGTCVRTLLP